MFHSFIFHMTKKHGYCIIHSYNMLALGHFKTIVRFNTVNCATPEHPVRIINTNAADALATAEAKSSGIYDQCKIIFWCWTQVISVLRKVVKWNILLSYNTIIYVSVLLWGSCYINHWSTTRYHECPSFYPPNLLVGEVLSYRSSGIALQWRYNEPHGVSEHQPHDCLLKHLFRCRSNKTSRRRVTSWPLWGEFTDDHWIPRTKRQ